MCGGTKEGVGLTADGACRRKGNGAGLEGEVVISTFT